jgi:hypothetical protein
MFRWFIRLIIVFSIIIPTYINAADIDINPGDDPDAKPKKKILLIFHEEMIPFLDIESTRETVQAVHQGNAVGIGVLFNGGLTSLGKNFQLVVDFTMDFDELFNGFQGFAHLYLSPFDLVESLDVKESRGFPKMVSNKTDFFEALLRIMNILKKELLSRDNQGKNPIPIQINLVYYNPQFREIIELDPFYHGRYFRSIQSQYRNSHNVISEMLAMANDGLLRFNVQFYSRLSLDNIDTDGQFLAMKTKRFHQHELATVADYIFWRAIANITSGEFELLYPHRPKCGSSHFFINGVARFWPNPNGPPTDPSLLQRYAPKNRESILSVPDSQERGPKYSFLQNMARVRLSRMRKPPVIGPNHRLSRFTVRFKFPPKRESMLMRMFRVDA